ncbi:phosphate/sulfate permease [Bacillus sp. TBS-096]|nr:phosphate/sulfate permease [Bacillus sp. TBS-096]
MEIAAILFSLFFALNIGASGAAASMGIAYGSGAIQKPIYALSFCAVGILAGSVIGGGEVVKTISSGIMPESVITLEIVCIIIGFCCTITFHSESHGDSFINK